MYVIGSKYRRGGVYNKHFIVNVGQRQQLIEKVTFILIDESLLSLKPTSFNGHKGYKYVGVLCDIIQAIL